MPIDYRVGIDQINQNTQGVVQATKDLGQIYQQKGAQNRADEESTYQKISQGLNAYTQADRQAKQDALAKETHNLNQKVQTEAYRHATVVNPELENQTKQTTQQNELNLKKTQMEVQGSEEAYARNKSLMSAEDQSYMDQFQKKYGYPPYGMTTTEQAAKARAEFGAQSRDLSLRGVEAKTKTEEAQAVITSANATPQAIDLAEKTKKAGLAATQAGTGLTVSQTAAAKQTMAQQAAEEFDKLNPMAKLLPELRSNPESVSAPRTEYEKDAQKRQRDFVDKPAVGIKAKTTEFTDTNQTLNRIAELATGTKGKKLSDMTADDWNKVDKTKLFNPTSPEGIELAQHMMKLKMAAKSSGMGALSEGEYKMLDSLSGNFNDPSVTKQVLQTFAGVTGAKMLSFANYWNGRQQNTKGDIQAQWEQSGGLTFVSPTEKNGLLHQLSGVSEDYDSFSKRSAQDRYNNAFGTELKPVAGTDRTEAVPKYKVNEQEAAKDDLYRNLKAGHLPQTAVRPNPYTKDNKDAYESYERLSNVYGQHAVIASGQKSEFSATGAATMPNGSNATQQNAAGYVQRINSDTQTYEFAVNHNGLPVVGVTKKSDNMSYQQRTGLKLETQSKVIQGVFK